MDNLLRIKNGVAVLRSSIPRVDYGDFFRTLSEFVKNDGFIVQFFAYEENGQYRLVAVVRNHDLYVLQTEVGTIFKSFTGAVSEKFHMFEREIAEQYGLKPDGHPWLKMVRYHENYSGEKDVFANDYSKEIPGNYPYFAIGGESIHEVGVGPVHAGIIEPGHFRFQCAGEEVLHLEIQLGYQHRGIEKMMPKLPQKRYPIVAESIAGDTAVGHNLCLCQGIEALAGLGVDKKASIVRCIALELERIANHVGDLGALSGDVAFNPPAAYLGRIRGEFLNLLQVLCGNRFGKGLLRPGGVAHLMGEEQCLLIKEKIAEIRPEIEHVCDLLFTAHTVLARFENTGTVAYQTAKDLGLVGYAGRACGLAYDVRVAFPSECYRELGTNRNRVINGDVNSRATVRREEIMHSLTLIDTLVKMYEQDGDIPTAVRAGEHRLAPDAFVVTVNEGWRGEVSHCILTDSAGKIVRYKIKDPSFHNWTGLAMSLRNQEISDFPLCNKSFNLSYCGFDL
ncbi:hydrogenase large subunit [Desulforhopalus singaporensis]|uniref:Ni,Fe-hydrogenase III large subunit n=1 Tax=Desulforhopalus singaporensis TaxID=91360 RepID=A0A1H0SB82_9BACT|nr:hydrogenase [Desulforhopalus singaporensis]SDP39042.1 Ni,Fe-hydrogenase III large subunit [Desulforhopalus singaporensis]